MREALLLVMGLGARRELGWEIPFDPCTGSLALGD
jgi:hypothetical protein